MNYLGHKEFGINHKSWHKPNLYFDYFEVNYWLEQWLLFYQKIFEINKNKQNCFFFCYEEIINENYIMKLNNLLNIPKNIKFKFKYKKNYLEKEVDNELLNNAKNEFSINPPETKEAYYYRAIFSDLFKTDQAALTVEIGPSIACSSPVAFRWSQEFQDMDDPSGRAVKIHQESVNKI